MFKENKLEATTPEKIDEHWHENGIKEGFEKFDQKYHVYENADVTDNSERDAENILAMFDVDTEQIKEVAGVIDTYIEEKMASGKDVEHANPDEIFNDDDFIEMIKPYGEGVAVPAICYWETLKQAYGNVTASRRICIRADHSPSPEEVTL